MPKTIWFFAEGEWHQVGNLTLAGLTAGIDFNDHFVLDHTGANARYLDLETIEDSELVMKTRSSDGVPVHSGFKFTSAAIGGFQVNLANESSFLFEQNGSSSVDASDDYLDARAPDLYMPGSGGSPMVLDPPKSDWSAFQFVNNSDANFEILNNGSGILSLYNSDGSLTLSTGGGDLVLNASNIGRIFLIGDQLLFPGLPTTDPGVTGQVWNSGGDVVLSGFTPGGGSGIQFDTDPQSGDWLLVTATGQTTTTYSDPVLGSSVPYSIVFDTTPSTSGSGRGVLIRAAGDGLPQLHALDINVNQTGGIAKGLWITANPTGTPTLLVMGDTDIEASVAGSTVGWRSFIQTASGNDGTAAGGTFYAQTSGSGTATGLNASGVASGAQAVGVLGQAVGGTGFMGVGVQSIVSGAPSGAGDQLAFHGQTSVGSSGPSGYGMRLRLDQTGGGTTHLVNAIEILINGAPVFTVDKSGNIRQKTGATVVANL